MRFADKVLLDIQKAKGLTPLVGRFFDFHDFYFVNPDRGFFEETGEHRTHFVKEDEWTLLVDVFFGFPFFTLKRGPGYSKIILSKSDKSELKGWFKKFRKEQEVAFKEAERARKLVNYNAQFYEDK